MPPPSFAIDARKTAGQARSRDTVEVILEAAARILEARGLAGYNTNAIAERAGVSIGSLYQYFPNKQAITRALVDRFEQEMVGACTAAAAAAHGKPLAEAIGHLVQAVIALHTARPTLNHILEDEEARLLGAESDADASIADFLMGFLTPYSGQIVVPIDEAVRDSLTIARAIADATLREGADPADSERRLNHALLGYLRGPAEDPAIVSRDNDLR